jgi:RimJ/RimL family protein N-acetyltransferase
MTLTFTQLTHDDLPMLAEWLARPHVAERWEGMPSPDDAPAVRSYIAHLDGAPIGYIQSYVAMGAGGGWWPDERDPGVRGIDQFLAHEGMLNRGIGTEMVLQFTQMLFRDPAVTKIQVDPAPDNARAIRCYERAGFRRVGLVKTPDGEALLMSLKRA